MSNIGGLRILFAASEQHYQSFAAPDVVHAPAWPEMLAHLEHPLTDLFHVTKVSALRTIQAARQTKPRYPVFRLSSHAVNSGRSLIEYIAKL